MEPNDIKRVYGKTRQATEHLLELIEEGLLDKDEVITAFTKYMSEDDVEDMCHINSFFTVVDEGDEEEDDLDEDIDED